ncbi:MAG: APC family permease [Alphaproteobacteria bacterium]|nr:APC family permease [Alphaproteobacteria bacterium]
MEKKDNKIGFRIALFIVVSNMVGTGVFTSLGFQLADFENIWTILIIWLIGGILALIGAFTAAELGSIFTENGGDYLFILNGIGRFWAYISAMVSIIVAFICTSAVSALALEAYISPFQIPHIRLWIILGILLITLLHSISIKSGSVFQNYSTIFKLGFIVFLIVLAFLSPYEVPKNMKTDFLSFQGEFFKSSFAINLLYVTFAFTGWNAAAYLSGEINNPIKNLPKSLLVGTVLVTVLYLLLQFAFLKIALRSQLVNKQDVAQAAFVNICSPNQIKWLSACIGLQLLATISSFIWIGSRVLQSMSKRYPLWSFFKVKNKNDVPVRALWFNGLLIIIIIELSTLKNLLISTSFILQFCSILVFISYFFIKKPQHYFKSPFSPYIQLVYIFVNLFFLGLIIYKSTAEVANGSIFFIFATATFFISEFIKKRSKDIPEI